MRAPATLALYRMLGNAHNGALPGLQVVSVAVNRGKCAPARTDATIRGKRRRLCPHLGDTFRYGKVVELVTELDGRDGSR